MLKVKIRCARDTMKEIFGKDNRDYNFILDFLIERYNIESASFIGPKIWVTLPNTCKDATSLKSENCPCR